MDKAASATFPTYKLARAYARTVRNAQSESSGAAVAPVEVKRCPEWTAEAQRTATRVYSAPIAEARASGQSQEDVWAD